MFLELLLPVLYIRVHLISFLACFRYKSVDGTLIKRGDMLDPTFPSTGVAKAFYLCSNFKINCKALSFVQVLLSGLLIPKLKIYL